MHRLPSAKLVLQYVDMMCTCRSVKDSVNEETSVQKGYKSWLYTEDFPFRGEYATYICFLPWHPLKIFFFSQVYLDLSFRLEKNQQKDIHPSLSELSST
jgi:hypothetical protein